MSEKQGSEEAGDELSQLADAVAGFRIKTGLSSLPKIDSRCIGNHFLQRNTSHWQRYHYSGDKTKHFYGHISNPIQHVEGV